jgi:hypothetical protein
MKQIEQQSVKPAVDNKFGEHQQPLQMAQLKPKTFTSTA